MRYYRLCHASPPCPRVRTHMCPAHTCTHMHITSHLFLLSLDPLCKEVGSKLNPISLFFHFLLQLLIMTLTCPPPTPHFAHFFIWFFWLRFCIFSTLIFFSFLSGKLEGDLILCPFQEGWRQVNWPCASLGVRGWGARPFSRVL